MEAHDCEYKRRVEELEAQQNEANARAQALLQQVEALTAQLQQVEALKAELQQLKKALYGKKSERMPSPTEALKRGKKADPKKTAQRRQANAEKRDDACVEEHEETLVPDAERACPQ